MIFALADARQVLFLGNLKLTLSPDTRSHYVVVTQSSILLIQSGVTPEASSINEYTLDDVFSLNF